MACAGGDVRGVVRMGVGGCGGVGCESGVASERVDGKINFK